MAAVVKPSSRLGWWAFGLGVFAFLWGLFAPSVPMMLRQTLGDARMPRFLPSLGMLTVAIAVILAVGAIVMGMRALQKGDRAVLVFVGFVPAVLSGLFWVVFAVGEVLLPH